MKGTVIDDPNCEKSHKKKPVIIEPNKMTRNKIRWEDMPQKW